MIPARGSPESGRVDATTHAVLAIVQVAFGSLAVEGKLAMSVHGVSPRALAMARILGGAILFGAAHVVAKTPRVRSLRDVGVLAALAIAGVVVNQGLFLAGLARTSPMSATLLIATIPVFAAVIGAASGRDRVTPRAAVGVAVALLGASALTGFAIPPTGDLFVLLNAFSYALYVVFAKRAVERLGALTVVAWVFGLGALLFAPFGLRELVSDAPTWSPEARGLVAFILVVPTFVAYGGSAFALRRASPTLVAVYVYLQPLVVAVLAYVQLGHAVTPRAAAAAALILGGVTIVASSKAAAEGAKTPSGAYDGARLSIQDPAAPLPPSKEAP